MENCVRHKKSILNVTLSSRGMFRILLILFWTQHTVANFITVIFRRLPIISIFADYIFPALILISAMFALPYMIKNIRLGDLIFFLVCVCVVLVTLMLPLENVEYLKKDFSNILFIAVPMFFVGIAYSHDICKKDLFVCSLINVLIMVTYQAYRILIGDDISNYNMNASYNILPSAMYLMYWARGKKDFKYWLFAIIGFLLICSYGTRGPVLAYILFCIVLFILVGKHSASLKAFVFSLAMVLIAFSSLLTNLVTRMQKIFSNIGLSTRIFDFFIAGDISNDTGRREISETIINGIKERPLLGYGLMGDRTLNKDGFYVHNIFLELWCQFGVIIGSAIIIAVICIVLKALFKSKKDDMFAFVLMLACMVFTKLMLSGSYITEPYFFFMIGVAINCIRNKNTKHRRRNDENSSD